VIFSTDGHVIGMHLESVNEAHEQIRLDATDEEIVGSINSLISGLSQGFIGLRLDCQEVYEIIFPRHAIDEFQDIYK